MEGLTTNGLIAACLIILIGIVINWFWSAWSTKRNHKKNGSNPESPMREDCRTMFVDIKTELSQHGSKLDGISDKVQKIENKLGV